MAQRGRPRKVAAATTTSTAAAVKTTSDIKVINKLRVASKFNSTVSVDADFATDTITIGFVPLLGCPKTVTLVHPTLAAFGDAIEKLLTDSHEAVKTLVKQNASALILKALTVSNDPLKDQVSKSNADVKAAIAFNDEIKAQAAEAAMVKANLRAAKEAIEAELAEL